jgi:hypothetical protein
MPAFAILQHLRRIPGFKTLVDSYHVTATAFGHNAIYPFVWWRLLRDLDIVVPISILVLPISSARFVVCTVALDDVMAGCWVRRHSFHVAYLLLHVAIILYCARLNAVPVFCARTLCAMFMCLASGSEAGNGSLTARICSRR